MKSSGETRLIPAAKAALLDLDGTLLAGGVVSTLGEAADQLLR